MNSFSLWRISGLLATITLALIGLSLFPSAAAAENATIHFSGSITVHDLYQEVATCDPSVGRTMHTEWNVVDETVSLTAPDGDWRRHAVIHLEPANAGTFALLASATTCENDDPGCSIDFSWDPLTTSDTITDPIPVEVVLDIGSGKMEFLPAYDMSVHSWVINSMTTVDYQGTCDAPPNTSLQQITSGYGVPRYQLGPPGFPDRDDRVPFSMPDDATLNVDGPHTAQANPDVSQTLNFGGAQFGSWFADVMTVCTTECNGHANIQEVTYLDSQMNETLSATIQDLPTDTDHDGVPDETDNCDSVQNRSQANHDDDAMGDACDDDDDNDGLTDVTELGYANPTDPLELDSDFGGIDDGTEVGRGTDPLNALDDPPPIYPTLFISGEGYGYVTSTPAHVGSGIRCPSLCDDDFNLNGLVTITAHPGPIEKLDHWTGDCAITGTSSPTDPTCVLSMDTDKHVGVHFKTYGTHAMLRITRTGSHFTPIRSRSFMECKSRAHRGAYEEQTCIYIVNRRATKRMRKEASHIIEDALDPTPGPGVQSACDFLGKRGARLSVACNAGYFVGVFSIYATMVRPLEYAANHDACIAYAVVRGSKGPGRVLFGQGKTVGRGGHGIRVNWHNGITREYVIPNRKLARYCIS